MRLNNNKHSSYIRTIKQYKHTNIETRGHYFMKYYEHFENVFLLSLIKTVLESPLGVREQTE